ncbi:hypothetical protein [Candidatus Odyssella acanthamoebae]|nr:hypothetical protein [Candidatus Paracaedibacter acanthamoebae]
MTQLSYVYLAYGFALVAFTSFGIAAYRKLKRTNQDLNRLDS